MEKVMRCRDVGMDCDFQAKGQTERGDPAEGGRARQERSRYQRDLAGPRGEGEILHS